MNAQRFTLRILLGVSVFLSLLMFTPVLASGSERVFFLVQEGGRQVSRADWEARIPLFFAVTTIPIIIDAVFIFYMTRTHSNPNK